jgi:hypothetical protein
MDDMSEAARWQERKQHWLGFGLPPSVAGYFAWWYSPEHGDLVEPDDWGRDRPSRAACVQPSNWKDLP